MIKVNIPGETNTIIRMSEMKPYDIGIVLDSPVNKYNGRVVMRDPAQGEDGRIISLSEPQEDRYWGSDASLKVKLLPPGTILQIEII